MSEKTESGVKKGAKSFVVGESFISCPDRTFGRPYCFLPSIPVPVFFFFFFYLLSPPFDHFLPLEHRVREEER